MIALSELRRGQRGRISAIDHVDPHIVARLRRLGFMPGTEVAVQRKAPLGDPVVYRVAGASICLRKTQSRSIAVTLID